MILNMKPAAVCLAFLGAALANAVPGFHVIATARTAGASVSPQMIADDFSAIKSMSGDFVQYGPKGERTAGKFFLERPGKIRFNYTGRSTVNVISDGKSLVIVNKALHTSRLYSLSKTPLKFLLGNTVDFSSNHLKSIKEEGNFITIQLADRSGTGNSTISMMFDRKSYALRKWTIVDERGLATTVEISNTKNGAHFAAGTFTIDYTANREINTRTK